MKILDFKDDLNPMEEDRDLLEDIMVGEELPDSSREKFKSERRYYRDYVQSAEWTKDLIRVEDKGFRIFYLVVAIASCVTLIGILLFTISFLPRYGFENPVGTDVVRRYLEHGLEETGAVNIIAGIILDYRAFDTLGESHVLFTALMCVTVLLRRDNKNMRSQVEDFYKVSEESYHELYSDTIIRLIATVLLPCLFLYGTYVLLNGQNSPGGGFSGGTVVGSGLIIFAASYGFKSTDRVFTNKVAALISFFALGFYSFAKGYVFFTGANHIENPIPKGTPGAILSGGLILPLDIAVGLVVACTMFGFYSLFRRGMIGQDGES